MDRREILIWACCAAAVTSILASPAAAAIGVNYGTMMSHPMLPTTVVKMIQANGIKQVKLFDADAWTLSAFGGTDIEVMVAIPNEMLSRISGDYDHAKDWVKENVTKYTHDGGVNIKYVAVGNEPFLTAYNGSFMNTTFPALKNIQKAIEEAGLANQIKVTVPLNADVYNSPDNNPVPSAGVFRSDIRKLMVDMVIFMFSKGAPFTVNIYPFLSLYQNPDFPVNFAFFDGGGRTVNDQNHQYTNVFDANYDTLVWALKKAGVGDMKILVGEAGWPTDGDKHATFDLATRFYDGFLRKMAKNEGTPMRPGELEVYLFGLVDEDMKSVAPGNFERHWGIFTFDGRPKFPMDLSGKGNDNYLVGAVGVQHLPDQWCVVNPQAKDIQAKLGPNVEYACSLSDCTSLGYGSSCNHLDRISNASYAFNMYFQMQDQDIRACDFGGIAMLTTKNASKDGCFFPIQIISAARPAAAAVGRWLLLGAAALGLLI
ncbi:hypothetical protein Cni_G22806 [Canna indica]|uniref:glucan endo-1,3-beta-D-glucosidase n=1 Tax=Canna indica TaxID=4628 RepID=A0AAQ3QLX5_9LILI|nr:hypothetical protein Cni_G22806 [Canna indica]